LMKMICRLQQARPRCRVHVERGGFGLDEEGRKAGKDAQGR
jgi:hypothetical protein